MADYSNPTADQAERDYHRRREQELYDLVHDKMGFGYDDATSNFIDAVRAIIKEEGRR